MLHSHKAVTPARQFAKNALILIGVNLFMRTVGVSFNVYLSNRAGGEVMGLYALLSGVYGFALTLGSAGVHLGTTRLVADAMGETKDNRGLYQEDEARSRLIRHCMRRCLLYSLLFSVSTGLLMFLSADFVGTRWLGDARTVASLRLLGVSLPPVAISACLGGYFNAVRRVGHNSFVSILAQFTRILFCGRLLSLWLSDGVEMTCNALVLGGVLSEIVSCALSGLAYLHDRKKYAVKAKCHSDCPGLTRKLLGITLPVTFSASLRSGLITLEHALIPKGLKQSGASWEAALTSYGVLHSMVLPVVLFPSDFISSFSGLLIPEVAESNARGDLERVSRISTKVISAALIFSFGVAGIMSCYAYELGEVIYHSREAGVYIRMLAPLIPIMYVDSSVDAVLKGMGQQVYSMNVNIIDALASVILVWVLVPQIGLMGYVITIYVTEILNTTLSISRMLPISGMKVRLWKQVFGPLLCVLGACCGARVLMTVLHLGVATTAPVLIAQIAGTVVLYIALLGLTRVLDRTDLRVAKTLLPV